MSGDAEVQIERRGRAGCIVLDRPKALNALTLNMVRLISGALDGFERDPEVLRVVVTGAGGRAFCAGGDIRKLHDQGLAGDHEAQLAFWREEYILNRRIKRYRKPYVALIDGVVMGGGVGVGMHGSHVITGERSVFAMPEVGIGFFPDAGATWLLPRLPRRIGAFLAVTGLRAGAGDLAATGLATHFVPSAAFPALEKALEGDGETGAIVATFVAPAPPSPLAAEAETIEEAFASFEIADIRASLGAKAAEGSGFAARALAAIDQKSPASQAIALRQMRLGAGLSFEEAMAVEYRIVSRICRGRDFYEGVRATIIDKDNRPNWESPPGEAAVAAYFAPLGADELRFGETQA
jgi:enoyl-CoA hydratase